MAAHQAPLSLGFSRQEHGVGCHIPLQCMKVKSESEAAQCEVYRFQTEDFISHFAACSFGCQALAIICYVLYNTFGEGNGTPLQYFCLENPMDGGDW